MKNLLLIFPFVVVAAWASLKRRFVRAARDQKEVVRCWFCDLMSGPRHGFLWPTVKWVPPLGNTIPNFWREVRLAKWLFWSSKLYWFKNCFVISYHGFMFSWILQKISRERTHLYLGQKTMSHARHQIKKLEPYHFLLDSFCSIKAAFNHAHAATTTSENIYYDVGFRFLFFIRKF